MWILPLRIRFFELIFIYYYIILIQISKTFSRNDNRYIKLHRGSSDNLVCWSSNDHVDVIHFPKVCDPDVSCNQKWNSNEICTDHFCHQDILSFNLFLYSHSIIKSKILCNEIKEREFFIYHFFQLFNFGEFWRRYLG